ncbi:MAG TPA: oligopeptide transporter, OPT family [Candidatus Krumholzibacteria bacterium]
MANKIVPYVPGENTTMPESTLRALVLGGILCLVMCAANVYVGLYAGMTVSAAIPASVISMGVLRGVFRRGTILENNIVHAVASAGESLAAGVIFTIPAIVLLGLWPDFDYVSTTLIALAGGVIGVTMMVPLRKAMVIEQEELRFPEGVACAEVLKAGDRGGEEMKGIFSALGIGGLYKTIVSVVGLFLPTVEKAAQVGKTAIYAGIDNSPMLVAVGFICGFEISLLIVLGGAISFWVAIPLLANGVDFGGDVAGVVNTIWDEKIRFFGIGAMVVGGVYSIIKVMGSIKAGMASAVHGFRFGESKDTIRTEKMISGRWLIGLTIVCVALMVAVYYRMTGSIVVTAVTTPLMFVLCFFFVAVAAYIVGLVGSSNSPTSGMTICTVLIAAGIILVFGITGTRGMLATLGVAGVVCCAASLSGDICQDLKISQIVGGTPRNQAWAAITGTVLSAFIVAPVLTLLHKAYGIGAPAHEGATELAAPQAMMFRQLVGTIFTHQPMPWTLLFAGAGVGVAAIIIDAIFLAPRNAKFRLYVMPLAVGMYLPFTVTTPLLLGGVVYWLVERNNRRRNLSPDAAQAAIHRGFLFSSGLVAGEAIMGIVIAGLVVAKFPMPLMGAWASAGVIELVSLAALLFMTWMLLRKSNRG